MKRIMKWLTALVISAVAFAALGQQFDPTGGGQRANITAGYIAPGLAAQQLNFRNILDNGAFNLYQRGTTAVTGITNTATYHADRWAGYGGASSSITLTNITSGLPLGFSNAEQLQRASSNSNLAAIFLVQEIPTADVIPLQGQNVCVSAYLQAGANYSAASSVVTVQVITGTGTDQGLASLIAATWTGQATTLNNSAQVINTNFVRYSPGAWCFTMPSNATEAAVQFGFTPVGTAGTTDAVIVTGAQLEQIPLPPAGAAGSLVTPFEQRPLGVETVKAQRYFWQLTESNTANAATCYVTGSNTQVCALQNPVVMRAAPTAGITAGGFQVVIDGAAATAVVTMAAATGTVNTCQFTLANTTTAAVHAVSLRGSGTTGKVTCTADL